MRKNSEAKTIESRSAKFDWRRCEVGEIFNFDLDDAESRDA